VFPRSDITPPKVIRFGWNLEHSENTVGCWPCQILGAIRAVATAGEPGEILFLFCQVSNARCHRLPVGQISRNLCNTLIGEAVNCFATELRKFCCKGWFFQKARNFCKKIQRLATSGRHNSVMIIDLQIFITKWAVYMGCLVYIFWATI